MIILGGLFLLWQFIVSPIFEGRSNAQAERAAAVRDLNIVARAAPALGQAVATDKAAFDRSVIIARSREAGLAISRMQPGRDGALQIWFDEASAQALMSMLNDVYATYNVTIPAADITRRDNGRVSAQIILKAQS